MNPSFYFVAGLIAIALLFDYINGFHDAANSIATVVSTRVLSPGKAVIWAAFFNFVAAFTFGTAVASTVGSGMIHIELVEQRIRRGGEFGVVNAAVLVPVHHRRGDGLVGIHPRLIDRRRLVGIQTAIVMGVMSGEFRFQPGNQLCARQGAVVVGVELQDHRGIAAVIILIAGLFVRTHPGRRLSVTAASGQRQGAKQDQGQTAQRTFPCFAGNLAV